MKLNLLVYDFSAKKQHICKQFSVIKQLGRGHNIRGGEWLRLFEVARQAVFSASQRHFLDCESETLKHLSASARRSAKLRAPVF